MANPDKKSQAKPIEITRKLGEDDGTSVARAAIDPAVQAATTAKRYVSGFGDLELADLLAVLKEQTSAANDGEMGRAEEMLAVQAHSLDSIFNLLAQRAADNLGHYPETVERYLKLALRAQSQSRATWETLSTIKNPPMANYVGQANRCLKKRYRSCEIGASHLDGAEQEPHQQPGDPRAMVAAI